MNMIIYKNYKKINILQPINNVDKNICDYDSYYFDELLKSFALSLQIPKNAFILDKSIGSDFIFKVKQLNFKNFKNSKQDLLYLVQELASDFPELEIENLEYSVEPKLNLIQISIFVSDKTNQFNNNKYLIFFEVLI